MKRGSKRILGAAKPVLIDRYVAADSGKHRFYTGEPCKRGHLAERFVSSGGCCACAQVTVKYADESYFWQPRLRLKRPITGSERNEYEAKIQGWLDYLIDEADKVAANMPAVPASGEPVKRMKISTDWKSYTDPNGTVHPIEPK